MGKGAGAGKNEWGEGGKARLSVDITTAMLVRIHYHGWFGFSTYSREILLGLTCFQHVYISAGLDSVHFQYFHHAWLGYDSNVFGLDSVIRFLIT